MWLLAAQRPLRGSELWVVTTLFRDGGHAGEDINEIVDGSEGYLYPSDDETAISDLRSRGLTELRGLVVFTTARVDDDSDGDGDGDDATNKKKIYVTLRPDIRDGARQELGLEVSESHAHGFVARQCIAISRRALFFLVRSSSSFSSSLDDNNNNNHNSPLSGISLYALQHWHRHLSLSGLPLG